MKRTPMGTAVARHFVATRLPVRTTMAFPVGSGQFHDYARDGVVVVVVVTRRARIQGDYTRRAMNIVHGERSQNARTLKRFACVSK